MIIYLLKKSLWLIAIILIAYIAMSINSGPSVKPEAACTDTRNGGCYGIEYCYPEPNSTWVTCYHEYNGKLYDRDGNPIRE